MNDIKNALFDMIGKKTSYYRYLPEALTEEALSIGLYVMDSGYTLIPSGSSYPPRSHDQEHDFDMNEGRTLFEYQLVYITRGQGTFESELSGPLSISAGMIFVLFPGVWHRYAPDSETGWDEYWIGFNGVMAKTLFLAPFLNPKTPVLSVGQQEEVLRLFIETSDALETERAGYPLLTAAWTLELIARLRVIQQGAERDSDLDEMVRRARCRLREQVNGPVHIPDLAKELHVGYSLFRKVFTEYTGVAPAQYHLQLRIHKARELLAETSRPIHRIAEDLGFGSPYYFSRIFTAKTGQSPKAFRTACHKGV